MGSRIVRGSDPNRRGGSATFESQEARDAARRRLLELLRASVHRGSITLASGRTTDFYLDGRQVTLDPEGLDLVSRLAVETLAGRCDAVGGPTSGADPMVAGIGLRARDAGVPLSLFFVRKETKQHGLQRLLEGPPLADRARVAIVDDTATTGSSLVRAADWVAEESSACPCLALVVVDRQEGARERVEAAGMEFVALFTRSEITAED